MTAQNYTFRLDLFTIYNTRAQLKDRDYVTISLAVAGQQPMTKIRAMGDLDNGTYDTGLAFENVSVDDDQMVRFSYTIINNGHSDPNALEKALLKTAPGLAKQAGDAVDPLLGQLFNWLVTEIGTALFADCDGPVAASVHQFSGAQLRDGTNSSGTVSHNDRNLVGA